MVIVVRIMTGAGAIVAFVLPRIAGVAGLNVGNVL
jgi:hypothetical protein